MPFVINGSEIANSMNEVTAEAVSNMLKRPFLAIITVCSSTNPNNLYARMKAKKAKQLGMDAKIFSYPVNITQSKLLKNIVKLDRNEKITGILVQLPLPQQINSSYVADTIDPKKDADGMNLSNIGRLSTKAQCMYPLNCTARGIMMMLNTYLTEHDDPSNLKLYMNDAKFVVVGNSNLVGKPLTMMLTNEGFTVTLINPEVNSKQIHNYTKQADCVISTSNIPNLIKANDVKQGSILIDAGEGKDQDGHLCGDITKNAKKKSLAYSPVPHGVGPCCISTLMRQLVKITKRQ